MRIWEIGPFLDAMAAWARRAYRHSEIRKWLAWFKGKTLHWAVYLVAAILMTGGTLGFQKHRSSFFYVVTLDGQEVGLIRDPGEVQGFLVALTDKCSALYGMPVQPREEILVTRAYRPQGEEDPEAVKEALRQGITLVTEALLVTVDNREFLPVQGPEQIDAIVRLITEAFVNTQANIKLLEVNLVEDIAGKPCTVLPEDICSPDEVAALLLEGAARRETYTVSRGDTLSGIASRHALGVDELRAANPHLKDILQIGDKIELRAAEPLVHVTTVEEVTVIERIPFNTDYTYNSTMWTVQSRVTVPGVPGRKQVTYHITRENGVEVARQSIDEIILEKPTTQVIERGTARVPSYGTGRFIWPIPFNADGGGRITQGFRGVLHRGIDITASTGFGTPIIASDGGVVVASEYRWPMGNYIIVYHGQYYTLYLHNSTNLVKAGAVVQKGQVIAYMGSTGRSTGAHLHFEIRRCDGSGEWLSWDQNPLLNPLTFFNP